MRIEQITLGKWGRSESDSTCVVEQHPLKKSRPSAPCARGECNSSIKKAHSNACPSETEAPLGSGLVHV